MGYQFTPAVERALEAAAVWGRTTDGIAGTIGPIETLLGLLHETECRAARLLTTGGVDEANIRASWPELTRAEPGTTSFALRGLSAAVEEGLRAAAERLDESPRALQFATEHLLLGLTLADDEVGTWLRERGIDAAFIERDLADRYGGERSAIAIDLEEPIPLAEAAATPILIDGESPASMIAMTADLASDSHRGALRIFDAASNRAGEALRVVEDYVRFVLDDPFLLRLCKEMRHELTAVVGAIPLGERLAARDTVQDVGTGVSTTAEMTRRDLRDVAGANLRRLQESLRSLEEYAKLLDPNVAARCEQLRYRSYTLQQTIVAASSPAGKLAKAQIYVLIDGAASPEAFAQRVRTLVDGGVDVLQLRDKKLDDRTLVARGRLLRELTRGTATTFIMNDRPDLALLTDADGVHVGQEELTVHDARRIVGPNRIVGVSTHSLEQARRAVLDGADYLGVGPTFPSTTKSFAEFPGLEFVRAVAAEIRLPAFAIGGITLDNVGEVARAGLRRVAVSGAIASAQDPVAAIQSLRRLLQ
jgi:thiamine-phosphate pyrophosphorylase